MHCVFVNFVILEARKDTYRALTDTLKKRDYIEDFVATQQRKGRRFVRRVDKTDRYKLVSAEVAFEKTLSELNTTLAPDDIVLAYLQPTHMLRLFSPTWASNRT